MSPVASTRMYNVAPGAAAAWERVLDWVASRAEVPLEIVPHAPPAALADLWARPDLACGFMCGWPLAQEGGRRPVLAAPVPAGAQRARYHSVFVVASATPFTTLAQTQGHRFAFNAKTSHSGWNMPQAHLTGLGITHGAQVGPFGPHQAAAAAVADGAAEVAALDSLVWALLQRHDPALAGRLRPIDRTPDQPAPPLVAASGADAGALDRLREALLAMADDPAGRPLLHDVCLARFAPARAADYEETLLLAAA